MTHLDRHVVDLVAPPIYAAVDFLVIVGPAVAILAAGDRGGMGDAGGRLDLLWGSVVLGAVHAVVAWRRLRHEEVVARHRLDMWIASVNALIVLALSTPVLIMAVLFVFADEHASLADASYPVVALWVGVQLVAVGLAELTGRWVFWWLEPSRADQRPRAVATVQLREHQRREMRRRQRHRRRRRGSAR
jgi:hypothetical protein